VDLCALSFEAIVNYLVDLRRLGRVQICGRFASSGLLLRDISLVRIPGGAVRCKFCRLVVYSLL
jgi:hypothetical protein